MLGTIGMESSVKKRLRRCAKSVIRACRWVLDCYRSSFEECPPAGFQCNGAIANHPSFSAITVSFSFQTAERRGTRDEDVVQRFQGGTGYRSLKATTGRVMPMGGGGELEKIGEE